MDSRPALSHTGCFGGSAAAAGAPLPAQLARSLACAAVATRAQRQDARSSAEHCHTSSKPASPQIAPGAELLGRASTATDTLATTGAAGPWPTR